MTDEALGSMIRYNGSDVRRINHAMKVFSFARHIGIVEGLTPTAQTVLEYAAILHDIGIHAAEEKHHSSSGAFQELEGPPIVRGILGELGVPETVIERACFLVGHHHSYSAIDGLDFQILVEADFLVNVFEDGIKKDDILVIRDRIFKTKAGTELLESMYL